MLTDLMGCKERKTSKVAKRELLYASVAGVLSLTLTSQFVCFPVFAEGAVDISIVELVDDGSGGYKPWEDITGAMPGMTDNAVPQVRNDGTITVPVTMCLTESGKDGEGKDIVLDPKTFQIDINDGHWTKVSGEDSGGVVASPILVCYKHSTELAPGELTEPLFHEVYLSEELGNEHQNATFTLHLDAYAGEDVPEDDPTVVTPEEPDTGAFTNSEPLTVGGYVVLSLGAVILTILVFCLLKRRRGL